MCAARGAYRAPRHSPAPFFFLSDLGALLCGLCELCGEIGPCRAILSDLAGPFYRTLPHARISSRFVNLPHIRPICGQCSLEHVIFAHFRHFPPKFPLPRHQLFPSTHQHPGFGQVRFHNFFFFYARAISSDLAGLFHRTLPHFIGPVCAGCAGCAGKSDLAGPFYRTLPGHFIGPWSARGGC